MDLPRGPGIIISLCSLTKIFQPKMLPLLKKNPQLVFDPAPFDFVVRKESGDINFKFGKPQQIHNIDTLNWLLGGDDGRGFNGETDYTGLVELPMASNVLEMSTELLMASDDTDGFAKKQKELSALMDKSYKAQLFAAKEKSTDRVMRQIRKIHTQLVNQYQKNQELNMGPYKPSTVEYLCTYILAKEIATQQHETQELDQKFADFLQSSSLLIPRQPQQQQAANG